MQNITFFEYANMWNSVAVSWHGIKPDVNIIVGINGKGKTTLLNAMYDYYSHATGKAVAGRRIQAPEIDVPITYVRSFDVASAIKKKTNSPLYEKLLSVVNQNSEGTSFFDYRMRALNYPEEAETVNSNICKFFDIVNEFFMQTGKRIEISKKTNTLVFVDAKGNIITMDMLSAGEKQLLLILMSVFLMDGKPAVLLMDEPELSLHIEWQDKLISTLRQLNQHCQLIITTHSPSIFANGWEDNLVFMDDIIDD